MSIGHLLTERLYYRPITRDYNDAGDAELGAVVELSAMIERKTDLVLGEDGNEQRANYIVATLAEIPAGAWVWLPLENTNPQTAADRSDLNFALRRIRSDTAKAPGGFRYYETRFGSLS